MWKWLEKNVRIWALTYSRSIICTAFVLYVCWSISVTFGICGYPSEFKQIGHGALLGLEHCFGRESTLPNTYICHRESPNKMKPYWISRLSLHNSATPYRREHPSTLGRKKQMVVLYHLASYWFQICTINRYIIYRRLISEDIQDSNNFSIFVHMCSHNNAVDTTSFKYLKLKVVDDFCAHWTCHSMIETWEAYI